MVTTMPRRRAGFTLIELLVVLGIVALLLTLAVPRFFPSIDSAKETILADNLRNTRAVIDQFYGDTGRYPESLDQLVEKKSLRSLPIVGRLFGSNKDSNDKTEVVLSITPHLVRNVQRPALGASEFSAGTETSFRRRPDTAVRAPAQLPTAPGARPAIAAPAAEVVVTPVPAAAAAPVPAE